MSKVTTEAAPADTPAGTTSVYLRAVIEHTVGSFSLRVDFSLSAPWTVLFGPSGAGKTSLLRLLAGLTQPDAGRVMLQGRTLVDTAAQTRVAPAQRGIGFVSQRPALFPHLDVTANVSFPLAGMRRAERAARVAEMLELFQVSALARRMPADLSGGEKQRVVLARALAAEPRWLLLDEPFSGLDGDVKSSILQALQQWLAGRTIPALYVSHDVAEVFQTGAEVLSIENGRIVAQGPAALVLAREREALLRQLR